MKKKLMFGITLLMLAVTVLIAWYFSAQDATVSYALSGRLAGKLLVRYSWLADATVNGDFAYIVRKIAHFGIYTLLGMVISTMLMVLQGDDWSTNKAFIIGVVLAAIDEIHQSFVPGRCACFSDVALDALGVSAGILIMAVFSAIYYAFSRKARL